MPQPRADSREQVGWSFDAADFADDGKIGNDREQCRGCDKDERVVKRAGVLHDGAEDDGCSDSGEFPMRLKRPPLIPMRFLGEVSEITVHPSAPKPFPKIASDMRIMMVMLVLA
jgi:hypothetical protein